MSIIVPNSFDLNSGGGGSSLTIDDAITVTSSYSGWNDGQSKTKINSAKLTRYGRLSIVSIYAAFTQQFSLGNNMAFYVCSCSNNLNGKLLPYSTNSGNVSAIGNAEVNASGILYPCTEIVVAGDGSMQLRLHPNNSVVVPASDDTTITIRVMFVNKYSE